MTSALRIPELPCAIIAKHGRIVRSDSEMPYSLIVFTVFNHAVGAIPLRLGDF
jgi:hypothetical protein